MDGFEILSERTRVLLGDVNGRRYPREQLEEGTREALRRYDEFLPRRKISRWRVTRTEPPNNAVIVSPDGAVTGIRSARVNGESRWRDVTDLLWDDELYLLFDEPAPAVKAGEVLEVLSECPHSVKGLNGKERTTVPEEHLGLLCQGAAGFAMGLRANAVMEVFGKRSEDTTALLARAKELTAEFEAGLERLSLLRETARVLPQSGFSV